PPCRHRLAEDAEPRGGPERRHRQLRRARPDRDGSARRALSRRAERGAARRDRPAPLGKAPGGPRRRLLPRLRARAVRDRPDSRRRRRDEAVSVLRRRVTPWRVAGAIVAVLLGTIVILYSIPSDKFLLLPDVAHPVAPLVRVQGAGPQKPGT